MNNDFTRNENNPSVFTLQRKTFASCRRRSGSVKTTRLIGTSIRRTHAAGSSTMADAAVMETTSQKSRIASIGALQEKRSRLHRQYRKNNRHRKVSTLDTASWRWTQATGIARRGKGDISTIAAREPVWTSHTLAALVTRITSLASRSAITLAATLRMLARYDRHMDDVPRTKHAGTTTREANAVTRSRSVDVRAMQTTSTRSKSANSSVEGLRNQKRLSIPNLFQLRLPHQLTMFATNPTIMALVLNRH